ncbi:hypothetical protein LTR17_002971 [Elasticomyces elasticus]|nr:hypothetical protein LTR17_002971 [Elasticomyces elasticus]
MAPQQQQQQQSKPTKPTRPTKHSRASLSAKNPRGIYAPPTSTNSTTTPTSTSHAATTSTAHDDAGAGADADEEMATTRYEAFKTNKRDKRSIRHQSLLSKVRESGVRKKVLKRRRPARKLGGSGMAGLSDALPETESTPRHAMELDSGEGVEEEWEGVNSDDGEGRRGRVVPAGLRTTKRRKTVAGTVDGQGRMRLTSVKHKPGAAKRKAVMEGLERERMGRNLAGMVGNPRPTKETEVRSGVGEKDRWAALRKFIGGTMEKREVAETQA